MKSSLDTRTLKPLMARLKKANDAFHRDFPGEPAARQPVHTVYGGAHIFKADTARKMSETAVRTLEDYAPAAATLGAVLEGAAADRGHWEKVYTRVHAKLSREAVEDFRIDFEDGYGNRSNEEEDGHAVSTAEEVAKGLAQKSLPPYIGIRIKPFGRDTVERSLRTVDLFVSTLAKATGKKLPANFVITLPKVQIEEQAGTLAEVLGALEKKTGLAKNSLKFEIMVETTQSILASDGTVPLRRFADAGKGRCVSAHFGTYDYTAGSNIVAAHQTMANPVCDFAKHFMKVAFIGTGLTVSDGATNVMPVGPHKAAAGGQLTPHQRRENEVIVHRAWKLSYGHIRNSLLNGIYQGWDLHPAQLPVRYAAVYAFFLESLEPTTQRLKGFVEKAARATLLGDVFDDAATGQGLLNFFLRGMSCGAISLEEAKASGLTIDEIQSRSFLKILEGRRGH